MTQVPFQSGPKSPLVRPPANASSVGERSCGCLAFGCGGMLLLIVVILVGGYYAFMHTSLVYSVIERELEATGQVEIEGLKGSLSTGIELEKFRFLADAQNDSWSELNDIKLKFNGLVNMSRTSKAVLDEISVQSGRLAVDFGDQQTPFPPLDTGFQLASALHEYLHYLFTDSDMKVLEVKKIEIRDLILVDHRTGDEFRIGRISYTDLLIDQKQVVDVGNVIVDTDDLEVRSMSTVAFADPSSPSMNARLIHGTWKPEMNPRMTGQTNFDFDFLVDEQHNLLFVFDMFDGAVRTSRTQMFSSGQLVFRDYSPNTIVEPSPKTIEPQNVSLRVEVDPRYPLIPTNVDGGASMVIGSTRFDDFAVNSDEQGLTLVGRATDEKRTITATVKFVRAFPMLVVVLSAPGLEEREVWAQVAFNQAWSQLEAEQQNVIEETVRRLRAYETTAVSGATEESSPGSEGGEGSGNADTSDANGPPENESSDAGTKNWP